MFLKAFGGAPVWTVAELKIFAECFEDWGMTVVKMPGEMRGWGKLGLPK